MARPGRERQRAPASAGSTPGIWVPEQEQRGGEEARA